MKKVIKIAGMHCEHCKARVEKALMEIEGVKSAKVDLNKACAVAVCKDETDNKILKQAVEELGFEVSEIFNKKGIFEK